MYKSKDKIVVCFENFCRLSITEFMLSSILQLYFFLYLLRQLQALTKVSSSTQYKPGGQSLILNIILLKSRLCWSRLISGGDSRLLFFLSKNCVTYFLCRPHTAYTTGSSFNNAIEALIGDHDIAVVEPQTIILWFKMFQYVH